MKSVTIVGGGPAGLMAAEVISARGVKVDVYDSMPSVGRKLLMAGKSGLNITHSDPFDVFVSRYGKRSKDIEPMLKAFGADQLREWVHSLGIQTFIGTSGRVFPMGMKASPLLRAWLQRLNASGVTFHLRHKLTGFLTPKPAPAAVPGGEDAPSSITLKFVTPDGEVTIKPDAVVFALGWRQLVTTRLGWKLGSLAEVRLGVKVEALRPSNCGFDVAWSEHFREKYDGHPIKSVILSFGEFRRQGEFIVTKEGVQGGLIYTASAMMRDEIEANGVAIMYLDLKPDRTLEWLADKLSKPRGKRSLASYLEKTLGIHNVKAGLLREFVSKEDFTNAERLAGYIKALPVPLVAPRPLDEAISSAGGVTFESLDEHLMLKNMPGIFCAGEMLDWEAPTGGYLLTACFSSGYAAGNGVLKWLNQENN